MRVGIALFFPFSFLLLLLLWFVPINSGGFALEILLSVSALLLNFSGLAIALKEMETYSSEYHKVMGGMFKIPIFIAVSMLGVYRHDIRQAIREPVEGTVERSTEPGRREHSFSMTLDTAKGLIFYSVDEVLFRKLSVGQRFVKPPDSIHGTIDGQKTRLFEAEFGWFKDGT